MPMYTVVQGDCLSSIALQFGYADWRNIYNDPANASFRQLRPNPNLIYPGDEIFIPDPEADPEEAPTDAWTEFKIDSQKTFIRVRMMDGNNAAFSGKKYQLDVNGTISEGTTGGDGMIEKEIPANATAATLTVWFDNDTSKPGVVSPDFSPDFGNFPDFLQIIFGSRSITNVRWWFNAARFIWCAGYLHQW